MTHQPRPLREDWFGVVSSDARSPAPEITPWGFDLSGMDERVRPGDSFYEYANGKWISRNTIPKDRAYWSTIAQLRQRTEERVQALLEQAPTAASENARKAQDFYRAHSHRAAIEAAGLSKLAPALRSIRGARTHAELASLLGAPELGLLGPIKLQLAIDDKDPSRNVILITQSGLGLPNRDQYLSYEPVHAQLRAAYRDHIAQLLELIGEERAHSSASAVLGLEIAMAELHWPAAKCRQRELTYNLCTRCELTQRTPRFPWHPLLAAAGLAEHDVFVVAEQEAIEHLLELFTSLGVSVWQSYLTYHYLATHAAVLPQAIDQACFDFYGKRLQGQAEPLAREKRAVAATNEALGEAVGELYTARYFPLSHKHHTLQLVDELRAAFDARLQKLPWMSESTRVAARRKLSTFVPKIGFPDQFCDYRGYDVSPDDAFGNCVRARVWHWQRDLERLKHPTDRSLWSKTPQTVNASYEYTGNEIIFPAGILQAPFFDPHADPAVNYGAIGAVIGHEMGHGFDDQGAKSDEHGVLRTWWHERDAEAFQVLIDALVKQYDAYEVFPGVRVNGRLTVGENISDLGGLTLAHAAYRASLRGQTAPLLDGFTGDQRFFLAWAQIWRQLRREASQRNLLLADPHSPSRLRVDGVVRNLDAFYDAFNVQSSDALWLDPEARVSIW
jgi:predicted metalloendopeptidase